MEKTQSFSGKKIDKAKIISLEKGIHPNKRLKRELI